ncbi:hypothetical protein [Endozoicomonas sp. ALD040]|uniref:hypothetical protein n=1 Tax=unclassified Endozoicomonas TaxID=2644528 RepID=UPI003BB0B8C6
MANEDSVVTPITTHGVEDPDTGMSARQFGAQIVVDRTRPVFQRELSDISTSHQPVFPIRLHTAHELLQSPALTTTIDYANYVSAPELPALLCTLKQAGRKDLIDQIFIRHKQDTSDSHCNCRSVDDPACTINYPDPTHQPLLVVNYEEQQYGLYPSS